MTRPRQQGGFLDISVTDEISVDHSGTPRPYTSAMLQTWNKTCFQPSGVLEVSLQLPGTSNKTGLWPAAWMLIPPTRRACQTGLLAATRCTR